MGVAAGKPRLRPLEIGFGLAQSRLGIVICLLRAGGRLQQFLGTIEGLLRVDDGRISHGNVRFLQVIVDLFVSQVYETRRKDVVRLMISEGRRFPKLAEFYYREVLSRIIAAVRALLRRAAARGEVPEGLADFPQIIAAPGLVAIVWNGLFERFEPLDVRKMMKTHLDLLFARGRVP